MFRLLGRIFSTFVGLTVALILLRAIWIYNGSSDQGVVGAWTSFIRAGSDVLAGWFPAACSWVVSLFR